MNSKPVVNSNETKLATPALEEHKHTRYIDVICKTGDDKGGSIVGSIKDQKTYAFQNSWRGEITPQEYLHQMQVSLTFDKDLVIVNAKAETLDAPYPQVCKAITPTYSNLRGLSLTQLGYKQLRRQFGGPNGCTHINELYPSIASMAKLAILANYFEASEPQITKPEHNSHGFHRAIHIKGYVAEAIILIKASIIDCPLDAAQQNTLAPSLKLECNLKLDKDLTIIELDINLLHMDNTSDKLNELRLKLNDYKKAAGIAIGPSWLLRINKTVGESAWQTVNELLAQMGTTAIQTCVNVKSKSANRLPLGKWKKMINTCHAYSEASPVIQHFKAYTHID